MWQPNSVERALFRWHEWRYSLVSQWIAAAKELRGLSLEELKLTARVALHKLSLEKPLMSLYWICTVASDCNLEYDTTYERIVIPSWLPKRFDKRLAASRLRPGVRVYTPILMTEKDMELLRRKSKLSPEVYISTGIEKMFLPQDHELCSKIKGMRGRPKKITKPGKLPKYPDRLAVRCTVLKYKDKMTYVEIARVLSLPITINPCTGYKQSETARHLVKRGKKIIDRYIPANEILLLLDNNNPIAAR